VREFALGLAGGSAKLEQLKNYKAVRPHIDAWKLLEK
jgi:hypothetical protein